MTRLGRRPWPFLQMLRRIAAIWLALTTVAIPMFARAEPTSLLNRGVVSNALRRAIRHAGLGAEITQSLSSRARASGWMPELSVRVVRGLGASSVLSYQPVDRSTTDDSLLFDVRLRFSLDRIVFDPEEVALNRIDMLRNERRVALEREVIDLLATMERSQNEARALPPESSERIRAMIDFSRARARLEALTDVSLETLIRSQ